MEADPTAITTAYLVECAINEQDFIAALHEGGC